MSHCLFLFFPDSIDCRVQEVVDISIYDPNLTISEPILNINIPGVCNCDYQSLIKVKGRTYITSNTLGLSDTCTTGLLNLPDGVYTFKYSVCPNDEVFVEHKILRDCITRCKILSTLSGLTLDCDKIYDYRGTDVKSKIIIELLDMLRLLDEAKVDVQMLRIKQAEDKLDAVNSRLLNFIY
jgi:hypothetical protein